MDINNVTSPSNCAIKGIILSDNEWTPAAKILGRNSPPKDRKTQFLLIAYLPPSIQNIPMEKAFHNLITSLLQLSDLKIWAKDTRRRRSSPSDDEHGTCPVCRTSLTAASVFAVVATQEQLSSTRGCVCPSDIAYHPSKKATHRNSPPPRVKKYGPIWLEFLPV